jgi:hypothetical protein
MAAICHRTGPTRLSAGSLSRHSILALLLCSAASLQLFSLHRDEHLAEAWRWHESLHRPIHPQMCTDGIDSVVRGLFASDDPLTVSLAWLPGWVNDCSSHTGATS